MLKRFVTMVVVCTLAASMMMFAGQKKTAVSAVVVDEATGTPSTSNYSLVNIAAKMEKQTVGAAAVIGGSFYDYGWNSGGPTYLVNYKGKSYMIFMGKPSAAAKNECDYVYYNGTTFTSPQAVIPSATQATYFSGIDVFRGGAADGFAAVGAGWQGSGSSYFGLEASAGGGNFSTAIVTPDRDLGVLVLDSLGTVICKDTKGRLNFKIRRSTDFGTSWTTAETTVIRSTNVPAGQIVSGLDANLFTFPDGGIGLGTTLAGKGIYTNPVYTAGTANKDSADMLGYFKSMDKGNTWTWTTVAFDGGETTPNYYALPQNFGQHDMAADASNKVHAVFNGYGGSVKYTATETLAVVSIDAIYWDAVNGYKSLVNFDRNDTNINTVINLRSQNALGCAYPSIAIGKWGKVILCTWSQPKWNGTVMDTNAAGLMKYDIYYNFSKDGGATWGSAKNLTNMTKDGAFFGTLSERLDSVGLNTWRARIEYIVDKKGALISTDSLADVMYQEFDFSTTDVKQIVGTPSVFTLEQNYPNPFNPSTKIQYSLANSGFVTLKVYNVLGQEVTTLVNNQQNAGSYSVDFNASNLANGMYVYRIQAGNFTATKKMMLLK